MRLYNIYYVCKNAKEITGDLKIQEFTMKNGLKGYRIENWVELHKALDTLFSVACLKIAVNDTFSAVPLIARSNVMPSLSGEELERLQESISLLNNKLDAIIDLYESLGLEETKIGLEIKIPQTDSLSYYIDILRDLNFVFEQCPYCRIKDEQLKFAGTDVGSAWLTFTLISAGTFLLLNNFGKLVSKAIAIKSHFLTLKMQEEELEAMRLRNETTKETVEVFQRMKKLTYEKYAEELSEEIAPTDNGEEQCKVERSLEKLANLIDQGVEIYTSIETPKEIKAVFPVSDKQESLPDGLLKFLEDKETRQADKTEDDE